MTCFAGGPAYRDWRMLGHRGTRVEPRAENLAATKENDLWRLGEVVFGEYVLALGTKERDFKWCGRPGLARIQGTSAISWDGL